MHCAVPYIYIYFCKKKYQWILLKNIWVIVRKQNFSQNVKLIQGEIISTIHTQSYNSCFVHNVFATLHSVCNLWLHVLGNWTKKNTDMYKAEMSSYIYLFLPLHRTITKLNLLGRWKFHGIPNRRHQLHFLFLSFQLAERYTSL